MAFNPTPVFPIADGSGATSFSGSYTPEIFSGKMLVKFYLATVFAAICNTDYEGEIKDQGDTVHIRTCPDVAIRDYKIGTSLVYDNLAPDVVDLLINKGKYYGFKVSDVQRLQSDVDYVNWWTDDASKHLKIAVDSDILGSVYADADAANKGAAAGAISADVNLGSAGAPLQLSKTNIIDVICQAGQVLDEQNVPEDDRWLVIPAWAATRIKTSDLKDASLSGDGKSILRNGRLGMIDRFTIYNSNNIAGVVDGAVKAFHCIFGHRSALTFASQLVKNEMIPNPTDFGQIMRGLQVYGYKTVKGQALGDLYVTPAV